MTRIGCPECGRDFANMSALSIHRQVKHGALMENLAGLTWRKKWAAAHIDDDEDGAA